MAIDFRLTARQRELQLQSRKFAREVLARALEAETLPTPEERFAATRTAYEAIIAAGFLRKCIPRPFYRQREIVALSGVAQQTQRYAPTIPRIIAGDYLNAPLPKCTVQVSCSSVKGTRAFESCLATRAARFGVVRIRVPGPFRKA